MVTPLVDSQEVKVTEQNRGLVVELVGLAGAGKSSVYQALQKKVTWIVEDYFVWDFSSIPFIIKNIIPLIPILIRLLGKGNKPLTRQDLACLVLLNGWPEILRKKVYNSTKVILIDQGSISLMAYLSMCGPQSLHNANFQGWWQKIYEKWIQVLDIVVWLDTSEEVLIRRIRDRQQDHHIKLKSVRESREWLMRYRSAYEVVVNRLELNNHRMRLLRIDSGNNSIDAIVETVISEIETLKRDY